LRGVAIGASIGGNLFSKLSQSFVTGADVPGTADVPSPRLIGATGTVESEAFCVNDWPLIAGVIVPPRSPSVAEGVVIVASFTWWCKSDSCLSLVAAPPLDFASSAFGVHTAASSTILRE
jgi:hypothetical protein